MKVFSSRRVSDFYSDNRKSEIQNQKWLGIVAIGGTFAMCGAVAQAQQSAKVGKIGYLSPASASGAARGTEVLRLELRALGYIEGKNVAFEYRYADNKFDRLPALADELVRLKVDVLVASSTPAALVAKNSTRTIPIGFLNVSDPVAEGLVDTLARPGGNITGVTTIAAVLAGKRLELLKETVPKLSRVAVLWNPQDPGSALQWKESQLPARDLGLQLHHIRSVPRHLADSNRWTSHVVINWTDGSRQVQTVFEVKRGFATQEEAEREGLTFAKKWIDDGKPKLRER